MNRHFASCLGMSAALVLPLFATSPTQAATASLLPVIAPAKYSISTGQLVSNGTFSSGLTGWAAGAGSSSGASSLVPGAFEADTPSDLVQVLPPSAIKAGRAYTLRAHARSGNGAGTAAVIFRTPEWGNSYRTYSTVIPSTSVPGDVLVEFTAPAYTGMAEVRLTSNDGTPVQVTDVSLTMRGPITQTQPVTSLVGSYAPAGYGLVFNDEFNGTQLDRTKWYTRYIYNSESLDHLSDEAERYRDDDNQVESDGILQLVARNVTPSADNPAGIESGMIRSDFTVRYGYFETRVKMPAAIGVFPAFWVIPDVDSTGAQQWPPEIDFFEYVNNGIDDTPTMIHTGVVSQDPANPAPFAYADPAFNETWTYWNAPFAFDAGWHTIGALWTAAGVTTYVDGKPIVTRTYPWQYTDGAKAMKAEVLLNLAIGGSWAGRYGIDTAAFPVALQVDYVRVFQKIK